MLHATVPALLISAGCLGQTHGTAIAVYQTASEIVIAADSKASATSGDPRREEKICKIHEAGRLLFTFAGFYRYKEFDVIGFTAEAIRHSASPQSAAAAVAGKLPLAVAPVLERLKREQPENYRSKVASHELLSIFFVGLDASQRPVSTRITATVSKDGRVWVGPPVNCPGHCAPGDSIITIAPNEKVRDAIVESAKELKLSVVERLKKGILEAAKLAPNTVGEPISVIALDRDGPRWVQKGPCSWVPPLRPKTR